MSAMSYEYIPAAEVRRFDEDLTASLGDFALWVDACKLQPEKKTQKLNRDIAVCRISG